MLFLSDIYLYVTKSQKIKKGIYKSEKTVILKTVTVLIIVLEVS